MKIGYKPIFIRQFNKLEQSLQDEVLEKVELFKDLSNHKNLKVHKLHGKLDGCYSFSVNYRYRIVFEYKEKTEIHILTIGDHEVYKG